jgi:DNA-binding GntR family transcriptional regulator
LAEKAISEAYGVSRTPVREAILRLAAEGLVDILPQSGTFVALIPPKALPEAVVVRTALEEKAARLAAERASRSQVMTVQAIIEQLRESEASDDRDTFHQADEQFHAAIADMAGYPGIWTLVQQVKVQVDRYRRLTLPQKGRMQRIIVEHQEILDGVAAHDPERAAAGIRVHLDALIGSIEDIRSLNPDYFSGGASAN